MPGSAPSTSGMKSVCLATQDKDCAFAPMAVERRPVGRFDVVVDIKYCGVCASDVWTARSGQSSGCATAYPFVPGHEIAGVCVGVGAGVTGFRAGDHVGVGCLVDSCQACGFCTTRDEAQCKGQVLTYASPDKHGRVGGSTKQTAGGYGTSIVVAEKFAIKIPARLPLEVAGPLMCAGTTAYAPLLRYGAEKGARVGVVGLGGVGAMACKLAKLRGCDVTAISRSGAKRAHALGALGADRHVALADARDDAAAGPRLDLVIDTVPVCHDLAPIRALLKPGTGRLVLLGVQPQAFAAKFVDKIVGGTSPVAFSWIGGTKCTQDVVDLCAAHGVFPEVEVVPVSELPDVFEAIDSGNDAGKRYVLDLRTLEDDLKGAEPLRAPAFKADSAPKYAPINGRAVLGPFCALLYDAAPGVVSGLAQIAFGLCVVIGARLYNSAA